MATQEPKLEAEDLVALAIAVEKREVELARVLKLHPSLLASLVERAIVLVEAKHFERAETLLHDLTQVDNVDPLLPFLLGGSRAKRNDSVGAVQAYTESLARCQDKSDPIAQRVLTQRAWSYFELGRTELARRDLAEAAKGDDQKLATEAKALMEKTAT